VTDSGSTNSLRFSNNYGRKKFHKSFTQVGELDKGTNIRVNEECDEAERKQTGNCLEAPMKGVDFFI